MTSSSVLNVANVTSTKTFAKTDAQVAEILLWFIEDWADPEPQGLTPAQLNKWRLDQANDRMVHLVVLTASATRERHLRAEQGDVGQQALADSTL